MTMSRVLGEVAAAPHCGTPRGTAVRHGASRPARPRFMVGLAFASLVTVSASSTGAVEMKPLAVIREGRGATPFFSPRGIAVDRRRGEILLANTGMHRIEFFDLTGKAVGTVTHRVETDDGTLIEAQPRAMAVDPSGRLIVVDQMAAYVDVLDFRGRSVGRLELPPPDNDPNLANAPGSVVVASDGTIYVGTRGEDGRIYRFGPDLKRVGVWGRAGSGEGQLSRIAGLAFTPEGNLVVLSGGTDLVVQVFDPTGHFQFGFGRHEIGSGNFSFPSGVAVTNDGRIWATDELRQIIQVFDSKGVFLEAVGSGGVAPGQFQYPSALASDGDSLLAVAERIGNRMQLLSVR